MVYLPKLPRFLILIPVVLYSFVGGQGSSVLEGIRAALYADTGWQIEFEVVHNQYDQYWVETATMEIVAPGQYLLDLAEQTVKVDQPTIYTWNKTTDQVLIDRMIPGDVTIWDILSGNFEQITVLNENQAGVTIKIEFEFPVAGLSGTLQVNSQTRLPEALELSYGEDDLIRLNILKYQLLEQHNHYRSFSTSNKEIIDLRE